MFFDKSFLIKRDYNVSKYYFYQQILHGSQQFFYPKCSTLKEE